ncbi:hypothetical protein GWK47_015622 [Chionoecetes opilio]|uniref:Uncharacterized protein n=1 Tax=Chionoecetes opilio TaxID=41210 RepID=A0A8J4XSC6_CHIOP|nr:hypothetical protein GWK47_015622 [Chionoecetes opilio]
MRSQTQKHVRPGSCSTRSKHLAPPRVRTVVSKQKVMIFPRRPLRHLLQDQCATFLHRIRVCRAPKKESASLPLWGGRRCGPPYAPRAEEFSLQCRTNLSGISWVSQFHDLLGGFFLPAFVLVDRSSKNRPYSQCPFQKFDGMRTFYVSFRTDKIPRPQIEMRV